MTIDYFAMTKDELHEELEGLLEELDEAQLRVAEIEEDIKAMQDEFASRQQNSPQGLPRGLCFISFQAASVPSLFLRHSCPDSDI